MRKRKILLSLLIVIVTIGCIFLGLKTRYAARLIVTGLAGEGNGYVLTTSKNNTIVIDGGTQNDSVRLKQVLKEKANSNVTAWFLTSPVEENSGALLALLEDDEINIQQIYVSFNTRDWYGNSEADDATLSKIEVLLDTIYNEKNRDKVVELERRTQYPFDNCMITPLEVKNEEIPSRKLADQTVILKVDNTFKNIIFFGNAGEVEKQYFIENDKDQFDCDVVQFSENRKDELWKYIKPTTIISDKKCTAEQAMTQKIDTKENGEFALEIW